MYSNSTHYQKCREQIYIMLSINVKISHRVNVSQPDIPESVLYVYTVHIAHTHGCILY